jgi:hypothetical protein
VLERVDDVAYQLKLLTGAKLHDVFHVGLLKKYCDSPPESRGKLPPIRHGLACVEPEEVTKSRRELLVRWVGQNVADLT